MTAVLRWYAQHRENLRALGILAGIALALLALIWLIPVRAEASPYPPKPQPCVTAPSVCVSTPAGPGVHPTPSPPVHHLAATGADFSTALLMVAGMAAFGVFLLVLGAAYRKDEKAHAVRHGGETS
jgi:hypothetical protein